MDGIDGDDLLTTNQYTSSLKQNAGYGLTQEQRKFNLRQHVEQKHINLDSTNPDGEAMILDDDMLLTNPVQEENGKPKVVGAGRRVKEQRTLININSIQRDQVDSNLKIERNPETGLYTRDVIDEDGTRHIQLYNVDILNNESVAGPDDVPRPFFVRRDGDIGTRTYKDPNPEQYTILLGRKYTNVKSVRLLSVEVPNTIKVVNQFNNLIILDIRDKETGGSIPLKTGKSPFRFFLFQLTPGSYTAEQLAQHMEETANEIVKDYSVDGLTGLFSITIDTVTGKVSIKLNQPPGRDLEFHWRFWFVSDLDGDTPITQFTNLWYLLGFSLPFEINQDGTDKYSTERTNLFDTGVNQLVEGRVPDREEFRYIRPFRYPDLQPNKYIYMEIQGLGGINDVQNPASTKFKGNDRFAKIILNVPPGEVTHSFVGGTLFPDALPSMDRLVVKWTDFAGIPVDFQLRNHSFTLEIVEYVDLLETADYSSRRGVFDKTSFPDMLRINNVRG